MIVQTPEWVKDAVFYQIFPDRFAQCRSMAAHGSPVKPTNLQPWGAEPTPGHFQGGDLWGIIERLDYLSDLGITAVYLNPIFAAASNHRYNTHDYYQVDPILGGNRALAALLQTAHQRNIRIVLDGVFNHVGRGFFQFHHLLELGADSPYVDWFEVQRWPLNAYKPGIKRPNYAAWWRVPSLPKLNTRTPAVREFLWQVATHWIEQGVDGWRLDVPNEIDDDAFWQEFRHRVKSVNPEAYIVGELWHEAQRWLQGDQFDAQMNYLFTRAAFGFFLGENMDQSQTPQMGYGLMPALDAPAFAAELERLHNQLYHWEIVQAQLIMLGSHDTPRLLTIAQGDKTAVRLLWLCQMTIPGAPNIYYGDEIGLTGRNDPYCRGAFPWEDEAQWDGDLRADVRRYIHLRHQLPALRRGDFHILQAAKGVVAYQRRYGEKTAVIAFNAATVPGSFMAPAELPEPLAEHLVTAGEPLQAQQIYTLPPRYGRVWGN